MVKKSHAATETRTASPVAISLLSSHPFPPLCTSQSPRGHGWTCQCQDWPAPPHQARCAAQSFLLFPPKYPDVSRASHRMEDTSAARENQTFLSQNPPPDRFLPKYRPAC